MLREWCKNVRICRNQRINVLRRTVSHLCSSEFALTRLAQHTREGRPVLDNDTRIGVKIDEQTRLDGICNTIEPVIRSKLKFYVNTLIWSILRNVLRIYNDLSHIIA